MLRAIPAYAQAGVRIEVDRHINTLAGFSWKITIFDYPGGQAPLLYVARNTMVGSTVSDRLRDERPLGAPQCWAGEGPSVMVTSTRRGRDKVKDDARNVTVRGLEADTLYSVRAVLEQGQGSSSVQGAPVNARTMPAIDAGSRSAPSSSMSHGNELAHGRALPKGYDRIYDRDVQGGLFQMLDGHSVYPGKVNQAVEGLATDQDYLPDSGRGGLAGAPGGNGLCVMIAFTPRDEAPVDRAIFFYTGGDQYFEVQRLGGVQTASRVESVTFKCWGGGGGGGTPSTYDESPNVGLAMGGGAGFAQITVPAREGDVFTVRVGGGGGGSAGERGGKGGFNGGGTGGAGVKGGGGGGGGGASTITRSWGHGKLNTELLLLASGGGGGGSTDYCCAHGGAGGGDKGIDGAYP